MYMLVRGSISNLFFYSLQLSFNFILHSSFFILQCSFFNVQFLKHQFFIHSLISLHFLHLYLYILFWQQKYSLCCCSFVVLFKIQTNKFWIWISTKSKVKVKNDDKHLSKLSISFKINEFWLHYLHLGMFFWLKIYLTDLWHNKLLCLFHHFKFKNTFQVIIMY